MVRSRTRSPQSCSRISPAWRCREGVACWPGGTAASDADSAIPIPSTSGRSLHPSASAPWSRQSTLLVGKETATSPGYRAAGGAWEGRRPPTRGPSLNSTLSKLTAKFGSKVAAVRSGARPRCSARPAAGARCAGSRTGPARPHGAAGRPAPPRPARPARPSSPPCVSLRPRPRLPAPALVSPAPRLSDSVRAARGRPAPWQKRPPRGLPRRATNVEPGERAPSRSLRD